ncbi:MAG: proline--tRNA ligase [Sulfurimonas sp. RIFCSPHIGHO2_12_FULL_36_9]|uniref:proline--tRNA ligase n=1 Tax=Sulfurimonas sp. RIFCSPLOWO2_12_36_12 TaxID=1802253 RepID=UPI0008BD99B5|nr:proline--tRNA ligase [Sulfurimonas sp. RIFCSPLOWO2_12_36_12]OHD96560.1 MAG: proline--tRNA ligase [Sulfurimonas sp. RIFCSPHIGHO2_12_FULL_36_9]OHE01023.1 MAG: proline--tRNA ligase [Sulfurimonas sp. RIFCSPLOWO2_02_FULL_36_28]OHE01448.1 MAG: proline--tRNA ligase [Sulfurimonas sp. RIFCSPLOWO2_12_FULL_36_74]OHE02257.1 MAG: proline--tRNA ligase [Sulfurimonas sp. RIFCSPLOWO2_12_36_12]
MRRSRAFIPTTKEAPSDATLPSHKFLLRGGFINQQGAGLYNFMPLGKIVLEKIRAVVKEELDNAGCLEVQLSFVTPISLWERSGRSEAMGKEMLRIKDRHENEFVLSPTNEEAMVELVKNRVTSYKDLPLNLYQINTKFRDEARPRYGLLRGREFLMKDGYSFHSSQEDMIREFELMEETYKKIFTRLGLDFRVVEADSGAIGGTGSKEFHVLANSGEDTLVVCEACNYGANIETIFTGEEVHALNEKSYEELKELKISKRCSCGAELHFKKGIEVGHIFQLGTKYSSALEAHFNDENGKPKPFEMATFGIGVSRLIAAVIEQNHDENGCIWTKSTAPYMVNIMISNVKETPQVELGEALYAKLVESGVDTMLDDSKERFGFKMKDAELIGFPYTVIIGKELQNGFVQIFDRKTKENISVAVDDIYSKIMELIK